jgi:hypothetical protein
MILRNVIKCPGCSVKIMTRVAIRQTAGTKFYLPCASCQLPIEGIIRGGDSLDSIRVEFDEAAIVRSMEYEHVATVDPDIPMKLTAQRLDETGELPMRCWVIYSVKQPFRRSNESR